MNLPTDDLAHLARLALSAAQVAAAHIRKHTESGAELIVEKKADHRSLAAQVVTKVDREAQDLILGILQQSIDQFQLGLLAEELQDDTSRHTREYFWCIDPLDGTLPFLNKTPGYSVSIALVSRDGIPVIGIVHDPFHDTVYEALRGAGARKDGEPIALPVPNRSSPLTFIIDQSFEAHSDFKDVLSRFNEISREQCNGDVRILRTGGAAMNACWTLENSPAVYFKFPRLAEGGGSVWDFSATSCLFEELGAIATDIAGQPLTLNPEGGTFMNRQGVVYTPCHWLADKVFQLARELGHAPIPGLAQD